MGDMAEIFRAQVEAVKEIREERAERFANWLPKLQDSDKVISITEDKYKFIINTNDYGIIDFFPKGNKVLIRNLNKWIKPGLQWIISKLLNKKEVQDESNR